MTSHKQCPTSREFVEAWQAAWLRVVNELLTWPDALCNDTPTDTLEEEREDVLTREVPENE